MGISNNCDMTMTPQKIDPIVWSKYLYLLKIGATPAAALAIIQQSLEQARQNRLGRLDLPTHPNKPTSTTPIG